MNIEIIKSCFFHGCDNTEIVGTKVTKEYPFMLLLKEVVEDTDFSAPDLEAVGQATIQMPAGTEECVSSGEGKRTLNPNDFHDVVYRGRVTQVLDRENAAKPDKVEAIVYTRYAYLIDPDITDAPEECTRIEKSNCTHVLVAVKAYVGKDSPRSFAAFVAGIAGQNNAFAYLNDDTCSDSEFREKAAGLVAEAIAVLEHENTCCTVADRPMG